MTVLGFFLGLVIILQLFVLIGICRTNYKLEELDATVSRLNDLIVPAIGINSENTIKIIRILDQLADAVIDLQGKKKHKKKKGDVIYADNEPES